MVSLISAAVFFLGIHLLISGARVRAAQTSSMPFLAIAQGRQRLSLGEIGWWRIGLALAVWGPPISSECARSPRARWGQVESPDR